MPRRNVVEINEETSRQLRRFTTELEARTCLPEGKSLGQFHKTGNRTMVYHFPPSIIGFYHAQIRRRVEASEDLSYRERITVRRLLSTRSAAVTRLRNLVNKSVIPPISGLGGVRIRVVGGFVRYYLPSWWIWIDEENEAEMMMNDSVYPVTLQFDYEVSVEQQDNA
ncbi:hypothetical protein HDU76_012166, partial [Blyttiomyces sp. JEL0837]